MHDAGNFWHPTRCICISGIVLLVAAGHRTPVDFESISGHSVAHDFRPCQLEWALVPIQVPPPRSTLPDSKDQTLISAVHGSGPVVVFFLRIAAYILIGKSQYKDLLLGRFCAGYFFEIPISVTFRTQQIQNLVEDPKRRFVVADIVFGTRTAAIAVAKQVIRSTRRRHPPIECRTFRFLLESEDGYLVYTTWRDGLCLRTRRLWKYCRELSVSARKLLKLSSW